MRVLALVTALGEGEASTWVEVLAAIIARSHLHADDDTQLALETMRQAAAEPTLGYEVRQRLYEAAVALGQAPVARLFLVASPTTIAGSVLATKLAPERSLKPTGRPLTLGERKALARTHKREDLLLLLRDPHPSVVAILLDNPHVTETDIVRVAAWRQAHPDALAKVAAHTKWSVRHAVKRALVLNPTTPLADAMRLATTLRPAELAELAADPQLAEPLRKHAAELQASASRRPRA